MRVMLMQFSGAAAVFAGLRAKTLREIKGNMGQSESKERDFKE
jgi:hypothetical protein